MSDTAAIYVLTDAPEDTGYAALALARLRAVVRHLVVVTGPACPAAHAAALERIGAERVVALEADPAPVQGYRAGLAVLRDLAAVPGPVLLTGSHVFGPTGAPGALFEAAGDAVFAAYWHDARLDPDLRRSTRLPRLPSLDLLVLPDAGDPWGSGPDPASFGDPTGREAMISLAEALAAAGRTCRYAVPEGSLHTVEPRVLETDRLMALGAPCLAVAALTLDPLLHDLNATDLRRTLDLLRAADPELHAAVLRFALKRVAPRDFNTVADQYDVMSDLPADPGKTQWRFGTVAVFIHAYYAEMMPEFRDVLRRLPCPVHLFVSTASAENRDRIAGFLRDEGLTEEAFTLRVVGQNRGRDMSSLFITWRDVVLSGEYELALRLHSKRTPQVAPPVGESFKAYLFDNLAGSPGYVRNLLDMLEAEPDVGLVIPPLIHVGFATLGHSWVNNRRALERVAADMGLDVVLDPATPVAPNGTMFWFRTDALRAMFEWPWRWEDYNPEPHHFDGGLAHVQERLIGYCVQDRGYRIRSVMTQHHAARGYARLEYKLQLLASYLVSGHVLEQRQQLEGAQGRVRARIYRYLHGLYGRTLTRFPATRSYLRPAARMAARLLMPDAGR